MHKTLLKAKEGLEVSLCELVDKKCAESLTPCEVELICDIVDGIHKINKIIVDDSMRIAFYDEYEAFKEIKDLEDFVDMYDEFMKKREKEGMSYKKESERYKRGGY